MALTPKVYVTFVYNSITVSNVLITGYLPWKRVKKEVSTTISQLKNTNVVEEKNFLAFRIIGYDREDWVTDIAPMLEWALDGNVVEIDGVDYYLDDGILDNKPDKVNATYEKSLTWEKKGA